jgi:zinc-finger binding domain of transposase IS66
MRSFTPTRSSPPRLNRQSRRTRTTVILRTFLASQLDSPPPRYRIPPLGRKTRRVLIKQPIGINPITNKRSAPRVMNEQVMCDSQLESSPPRPLGEIIIIKEPQSEPLIEPPDRIKDSTFHEQTKPGEFRHRVPLPQMLIAPPPCKPAHFIQIPIGHILNQLRRRGIIRHRPNQPDPRARASVVNAFALIRAREVDHSNIPPGVRPALCRPQIGVRVRPKAAGSRRRNTFDHLPHTRIEHDLPESEKTCSCCGGAKQRIGEDISRELEFTPAQLEVKVHLLPKYACPSAATESPAHLSPPSPSREGSPGPAWSATCS